MRCNGDQSIDTDTQHLIETAKRLGVELSDGQIHSLKTFCLELAHYNEHTNLVSDASLGVLIRDHILDSLSVINVLNLCGLGAGSKKLIDIGSGAGFPGLILSIALPNLKSCLLEATTKKTRFLTGVIETLGLQDRVHVANQRAEELGRDVKLRSSFDFATARAFGASLLVAELALPFLNKGGYLLLQKSAKQVEEEKKSLSALAKLKAHLTEVVTVNKLLGKDHVILVIEKKGETPSEYPRTWAKMKNRPL